MIPSAFVIALDELRQRRLLFAGAALAGLAALVVPWLPLGPSLSAPVVALGLALAFALCVAVLGGLGLLSTDLAARRLGFALRLPVSASSLWLGRVGAAIATIALVLLATLVPASLAYSLTDASPEEIVVDHSLHGGWVAAVPHFDVQSHWMESAPWPLVLATLLAALLAGGHVVGLMFGLRDAWTLFDLVAATLVGALFATAIGSLEAAGARAGAVAVAAVALAGLIAGVAVGGWLQLRRGGVDATRSHRLHALTLWPLLLVLALGSFLWARGQLTPSSLDRLEQASLVASAGDGWATVTGPVKSALPWSSGSHPTFAVDVASGRSVLLGSHLEVSSMPLRSEALDALVWLRCAGGPCEVQSLPIDAATPRALGVAVDFESWSPSSVVLDASGRYLAVARRGTVQVVDLVARRHVVDARYTVDDGPATLYAGTVDGQWLLHVHRWADGAPAVEYQRVDATTGTLRPLDLDPLDSRLVDVPISRVSPPNVSFDFLDRTVEAVDPRTGARRYASPVAVGFFLDAVGLADGGTAVLLRSRVSPEPRDGDEIVLHVFDSTGAPAGTIRFGAAADRPVHGFLSAEEPAGSLWIGLTTRAEGLGDLETSDQWLADCAIAGRPPGSGALRRPEPDLGIRTVRVDLETLTVDRTLDDVLPLRRQLSAASDGTGLAWLIGCDGWPRSPDDPEKRLFG